MWGVPLLEVKNVSKHYRTSNGALSILTDINFKLSKGESASIVGPSGCGKSTLLYILGALEPPSSGVVELGGRNPFSLSESEAAEFRNTNVGFVFQDHLLLPQCTVLENVLIPTLVGESDSSATERAEHLINQVGLRERANHRPAELSGGERQRVALARALINQPSLLLCDEPTGNLDRASADSVVPLLFELSYKHDTVLIIVTHNVDLARRCSIQYCLSNEMLEISSSS